jgi:hypothetical protein
MTEHAFDTFVRRASASFTRRRSVKIVGASLAGAAIQPLTSAHANKDAKKAKKRCRQQHGPCLEFVHEICSRVRRGPEAELVAGPTEPDPECVAEKSPCCNQVAQCNLAAGLECLAQKPETK